MKKLIPLILLSIILFAAILSHEKPRITNVLQHDYSGYETDDTNYINGQILKADWLHKEDLKIVDADLLNWCNAYYNSTCDGDLADILRMTCDPLK